MIWSVLDNTSVILIEFVFCFMLHFVQYVVLMFYRMQRTIMLVELSQATIHAKIPGREQENNAVLEVEHL